MGMAKGVCCPEGFREKGHRFDSGNLHSFKDPERGFFVLRISGLADCGLADYELADGGRSRNLQLSSPGVYFLWGHQREHYLTSLRRARITD